MCFICRPLPKLVSSPIKAGPPVITDTPVIFEIEEIPEIPDTCPMSSHYSPQSHGHSVAQDDQSVGHLSVDRDQAEMSRDDLRSASMSQRTVSFDQRSISSEQHRSHGESHGGRISSGAPPSEAGSASPNTSLYDKLGGPEALETAVDMFYDRVLDDERLKHFFNGTNMMRLVIKQVMPYLKPATIHDHMVAFPCSPPPLTPPRSSCFPAFPPLPRSLATLTTHSKCFKQRVSL